MSEAASRTWLQKASPILQLYVFRYRVKHASPSTTTAGRHYQLPGGTRCLQSRKTCSQPSQERHARLSNGAADLQIEIQLVVFPKAVAIDRRDGESGVALPLQPVLSPEQQILPEEEDAAKLWLLSLEQTASGSYPTSSGAMMSIAKMVTL